MAKNKAILYSHGGSLNRGCEAIIRTTSDLLVNGLGKDKISISVASFNKDADEALDLPSIDRYISHNKLKRFSYYWFIHHLSNKKLSNYVFTNVHKDFINEASNHDLCFSVGGDNYCYPNSSWVYPVDRQLKKQGSKLVLWGCSIEPSVIDKAMIEDIRLFDLITPRESITYEALVDRGLDSNTHLHADPAFTLETDKSKVPFGLADGNTIGINVSPLIMYYERSSGMVFKSVKNLIEHILNTTDCKIALIPHVTLPDNNDLAPLTTLFDMYKDTNRILLIEDGLNASQLKGIISSCRLFIGARTHATIAAYSSCVPTLVLGYSVKSIGIAKDLFGDESGLVLPVYDLQNDKQIINSFAGLLEREKELRMHLKEIMPSYVQTARMSIEYVRKLLR